MSKFLRSALSVSVAMASMAGFVQAEEKGVYVGGNVHYTNVFDADLKGMQSAGAPAGPLDPLLNALGLGALTAGGGAATSASSEVGFDDDLGYGFTIGYKFASPFRAEFEYRTDSNDIDGLNGSLDVESMMGNLWYDFNVSERLRPYVGFGLGISNVELGSFGDDDVNTGQLGAGLYYHLSPRLVLDAGYRYITALDDPSYSNGGTKIDSEYEAQHLALGVRYNFFDAQYGVQDADGDGVVDDADQCPGTPTGVQVDSVGCPLDGDKDGVADYLDQCLNTPAGAEVDDQGCELDGDKDGVVDANDMCPDTPAGTPVMSNGCGQDQSVVLRGVNFEFNSAQLTVNAETILDGVASTLSSSPDFDVELQGHTDSQGSDSYNMILSQNRAQSVKNYLVGQGVQSNRLYARGYGEEQPVASNDTEDGRALNRRVELKVLSGGDEPMAESAPMMMEDDVVEPAAEESMMDEPMMEEESMMDEAVVEEAAAAEESFDEEEYLEESAVEEPAPAPSSSDEIDYDF